MTDLVNPAATGGIDFGNILAQTLGAYTQVSMARIERDTARYNNAPATQQAALHNAEAPSMLNAFSTGNAVNPGTNANGVATNNSIMARVPPIVLYVGLSAAGLFLLSKAWKK